MLNANANMSPTIRICPSQWNNHSMQQFFSPRGNFAPVYTAIFKITIDAEEFPLM